MSLFDLNQVDTVPMSEEDQEQTSNPIFTVTNEISSYPCPVFLEKSHGHGEDNRGYFLPEQLLQQEPKDHSSLISESSYPWVSHPSSNGDINNKIKLSLCKRCTKEEEPQGPGKCMSSKMRIVKKMNSEDSKPRGNMQVAEDQSQTDLGFSTSNYSIKPPSGIIRVCSNCNTTKTPLWRSGPHGPKSLCNACGIRQRKARRAMEAAVMNSRVMVSEAPSRVHKEKKPDIHHTLPFKKRCKITSPSTSRKQLRFEDVTLSLGTNSEFHEVFPQDERDAAILLMALSCDLIQS